jgi:hypothetical protein
MATKRINEVRLSSIGGTDRVLSISKVTTKGKIWVEIRQLSENETHIEGLYLKLVDLKKAIKELN